jgi:high-affinity nickel-transport protein
MSECGALRERKTKVWWRSLLDDDAEHTVRKMVGIYAFLLAGNISAWVWAVVAFQHFPVLLGTAFLAYSFGLRHAVDADHIAAIDS